MSPFSFFQRETNLAELTRAFDLKAYTPAVELNGLVTGVDNIRYDVQLSPLFMDVARQYIARITARAGNVQDLLGTERNPTTWNERGPVRPTPIPDTGEFKRRLTDLQVSALNRAKIEGNISLDLLVRIAILKFLRTEILDQFSSTLERLRARLKTLDGPRQNSSQQTMLLRERCSAFQLAKKAVVRKTGEELLHTLREVEKETVARMRRSLFGSADPPGYELFLNQLALTENGRDDFITAEHYVMLGNFDRDPDRHGAVLNVTISFLHSLWPEISDEELKAALNVPDNAEDLLGGGLPEERTAQGSIQGQILEAWTQHLEKNGVLDYVVAAYEAVSLLQEYTPVINAQQLKNALISRGERQRVEAMLAEHGKLSHASFYAAGKRVASCRNGERQRLAGRFMRDFIRYNRDLHRLEALVSAMDAVSLVSNDKLRSLSQINSTLYEFLLPEEQKPTEDKVIHHIVLKADIRDSTSLTRALFERNLNPASYFSLNFYEPINKLLPKYQASKVFIEGDAVILALYEREGEAGFGVARTCVLAREMISIVRAYNEQSSRAGLPKLELGIGISYQDSAPLYLMDGSTRIMISDALNESDRLSSCHKGTRRVFPQDDALFNVFSFQAVDDEDTGGSPDEFLMRYNVGGIHISEASFRKLLQEISIQPLDLDLPMMWGKQTVRLYSGLVPVGPGVFHRIVIREGLTARISAQDFSLKRWTDRLYYEVCTSDDLYELVAARMDVPAAATISGRV